MYSLKLIRKRCELSGDNSLPFSKFYFTNFIIFMSIRNNKLVKLLTFRQDKISISSESKFAKKQPGLTKATLEIKFGTFSKFDFSIFIKTMFVKFLFQVHQTATILYDFSSIFTLKIKVKRFETSNFDLYSLTYLVH